MPKIIENLEAKLLEEAGKQIEQDGYSALTMRSVAKGCGIGVGTVYNYFPCKEALVAGYLLQDWNSSLAEFDIISAASQSPLQLIRCIHQHLTDFAKRHLAIFQDEAAAASFSGSFTRYHAILRAQLAKPLLKFCQSNFAAEFVAEALLSWTIAKQDFDDIYGMLEKLF